MERKSRKIKMWMMAGFIALLSSFMLSSYELPESAYACASCICGGSDGTAVFTESAERGVVCGVFGIGACRASALSGVYRKL